MRRSLSVSSSSTCAAKSGCYLIGTTGTGQSGTGPFPAIAGLLMNGRKGAGNGLAAFVGCLTKADFGYLTLKQRLEWASGCYPEALQASNSWSTWAGSTTVRP